jgi:hypothetical protein
VPAKIWIVHFPNQNQNLNENLAILGINRLNTQGVGGTVYGNKKARTTVSFTKALTANRKGQIHASGEPDKPHAINYVRKEERERQK